jgi:hypothetical protein
MAKHPSKRKVPFEVIQSDQGYGATHFLPALTRFIIIFNSPDITRQQLDVQANSIFVRLDFFLYGIMSSTCVKIQFRAAGQLLTLFTPIHTCPLRHSSC